MTSARLVLAAQTNGKKSRGPKTVEGKRKSSANSRKHGLYAKSNQPDAQCEAEFQHRLAALQSDFRPSTPLEHNLVHTIALAVAQQHWASRTAVAIVNRELENDPSPTKSFESRHYHAVEAHLSALNKLAVMENRFNRQWASALESLHAIRANESPKMKERTDSESGASSAQNHQAEAKRTAEGQNRRNEPDFPAIPTQKLRNEPNFPSLVQSVQTAGEIAPRSTTLA